MTDYCGLFEITIVLPVKCLHLVLCHHKKNQYYYHLIAFNLITWCLWLHQWDWVWWSTSTVTTCIRVTALPTTVIEQICPHSKALKSDTKLSRGWLFSLNLITDSFSFTLSVSSPGVRIYRLLCCRRQEGKGWKDVSAHLNLFYISTVLSAYCINILAVIICLFCLCLKI